MNKWLFLPSGKPALRVGGAGETTGVELTAEALAELRASHVCVAYYVAYSEHPKVTEGLAHYGFKAPSSDGVHVGQPDAWVCVSPTAK